MMANINRKVGLSLCLCVVLFITSSAQKNNFFTSVFLDSSRVEKEEGIVFGGVIVWPDSVLMAQEIVFSPRYDDVNTLLSGNFELEFWSDTGFIAVKNHSFYNIAPLKKIMEANAFYKQKRFEFIVPFKSFLSSGTYRIRIRFYSSKYCTIKEDLYSNWIFFNHNTLVTL